METSDSSKVTKRDIMIHIKCGKDYTNQQRLDSFFVKRESNGTKTYSKICGAI